MTFTVKRSKPKTFDFDIEGYKKVYHIPLMSSLPVNTLVKAKEIQREDCTEEEKADMLFDFFIDVFKGECDEALDILKTEDFAVLFEAYVEASGTDTASAGE